jgi:WS/DGAT/MGAT family acyltransferase
VTGATVVAALEAVRLLFALTGQTAPRRVRAGLRFSRQSVSIARKLLLSSDPVTPLHGTPGGTKLVAWSGPRPLGDVKRVARLAGGTVNDVVVAAVSAALSHYLVDSGAEPVDLMTMVPVNVRAPDRPVTADLGNRFALVLLHLPTGSWAPLDRLAEAKRRMDRIKDSPEPWLTFGLITAIGRTPPMVERLVVDFFSGKAFGVMTNVPGPTRRRSVAGTPITGILGWVPGTGRQGVGVSIFTYDGTVRVGFKVDADVVGAPDKLVHAYEQAIDELLRLGHASEVLSAR